MTKKPADIINGLISKYTSLREFARAISEDGTDVGRWRADRMKIRSRAVIRICELHPEISPHELNPDVFPAHLSLVFGGKDE